MEYVLENGFVVKGLVKESLQLLDFLINCIEDADAFIHAFLSVASNENLAVSDYRQYKITQRNISLLEFMELYSINQVNALEQLLMSPIREQEFLLLTNKINNGKITVEQLFYKHKKSPRAKILRLLV